MIDITVDIIEDMNITSSAFRTTDFVKSCIQIYPSFFDLILFCKFWLYDKGFFDSYSGGINSFAFSLLYVSFLIKENLTNEITSFKMLK